MDVTKMSTEELESHLSEVERSLAQVRSQIEFAKSHNAETGDFSDTNWFNRARHALRMIGLEHQQILRELAKRKKEQKKINATNFERSFLAVARRRIDRELFNELWREAMDEYSAEAQA